MMKTLLTLALFVCLTGGAAATEQQSDYLLFDNTQWTVYVGWGHPSPLQTYFRQTKIPYPFQELSTANYRGHIATWVVKDDKFYLKGIAVESSLVSPDSVGIKSKTGPAGAGGLLFADWFSGVVVCYGTVKKEKKERGVLIFQIRAGNIISYGELIGETADSPKGRDLLKLNNNYIAYYFRLYEDEHLWWNDNEYRLKSPVGHSPVYALYNNEHLQWPYNWENLEKCGAANGKWKISGDSLILTALQLYSGLEFTAIDKENIPLDSLFPGKVVNKHVFADWVTDVYMMINGTDSTTEFGYKRFNPKTYTFCRIEKGLVKEQYTISAKTDWWKNRDSLEPRLRKLIDAYYDTGLSDGSKK